LIFTLAFAIFVAEAELDIIVPSFPEIQAIFGLTTFQTELILSVNLIAHCIMAIFAGMIGDKFGKKPAIIGGIIAFLLGSFVTIITNNYYILLLGRILQGGGAAFPMVLSFIVAIKSVSPAKRVKVGGILAGIATISVAIAPTIGSYITYYFGYKGNMIFIAGLGIVSLILCSNFIKHDGEVNSKASLSVGSYIVVFKSKLTMLYIFALGFELAAYYTFIALAPIYYINSLGVSLKHFGLYQAVITLSFGLSSFFSSDIIKVIGKRIALIVSLLLLSSSSI
jgi:DHA1 family bicyclomycin/chloramphenicol resistance-like MFS transporter